jgi:hypothetical protein
MLCCALLGMYFMNSFTMRFAPFRL